MADINEQVSNMYNAAKQALTNDLKQDFYNAAQGRVQAFRQINNSANARHAMFSGAPAAGQMQYDQSKFLPGIATAATQAINKQTQMQENWDKYMDYIKEMNDQANKYNDLAGELNSKAAQLSGSYTQFSGN